MFITVTDGLARNSARLLVAALIMGLIWAACVILFGVAETFADTHRVHPAQHRFSWHRDVASHRKYLTGNWYGWRDRLVKAGVEATVAYATDLLGNPTGGIRQGFQYAGRLDFDVDINLEKLADLKGLQFHLSTSGASGSDLSGQDIGNIFPASQIFSGGTVRLAALDLKQSFFDGKLDIALGRLGTGDEFITSPLYQNFVSAFVNGFPNSMSINVPSFSAFPVMTWGVRAKVKPVEPVYAMFGAYNSDPSLGRDSAHGVDFGLSGDVFVIGEVGYLHNQKESSIGLPGAYKFGAYYDSSRYQDLSSAQGNVRGNYGFYLQVDQMVFREEGPNNPQGLTPFAVVTFAPSSRNTFPFFVSTGFVYQGLLPGRDKDVTAFGLGYGKFSDHLNNRNFELVLEWTYEYAVTPWLALQPDIQYIIKPNGVGTIPNALVLGLQVGINF